MHYARLNQLHQLTTLFTPSGIGAGRPVKVSYYPLVGKLKTIDPLGESHQELCYLSLSMGSYMP